MPKRILPVLFLLLLLTLSLASCGAGDVPEGMQLASDPYRDGFLLYVPEGYTVDDSTGLPVAYVSKLDPTSISGYLVTPAETDVPSYFAAHEAEFSAIGDNFTVDTAAAALTVAGRNAYSYVYSYTRGETGYRVMQIFIPVGETLSDGLCILTYTGKTTGTVTGTVGYTDHMEDFERVLQVFAFPTTRGEETVEVPDTDGAPAGMQLASEPKVSNYYLFVPLGWTIDMKTGISSALAADRTSVSAVSYYPDQYQTIADYVASQLEKYRGFYDSVSQIGDFTATEVDGFPAYRYEFTGVYGGQTYRFGQVYILKNKGGHVGLYTLTFTASGNDGDAAEIVYTSHGDEFGAMLAAFRFR